MTMDGSREIDGFIEVEGDIEGLVVGEVETDGTKVGAEDGEIVGDFVGGLVRILYSSTTALRT